MITKEWDKILNKEYKKTYFRDLINFINEEYTNKTIFPQFENIYQAFKLTSYEDVKVVIIGQDPYHGDGQANGLAFSVKRDTKLPPSLKNIYKEIYNDLGIINKTGDLTKWAKQGVLLINAVLTVEKEKPASHKEKGWEIFTNEIIKKINQKKEPVIFVFWGNFAKKKKELITNKTHYIIESSHPSPFSAHKSFLGSNVFSKINEKLKQNKKELISWQI